MTWRELRDLLLKMEEKHLDLPVAVDGFDTEVGEVDRLEYVSENDILQSGFSKMEQGQPYLYSAGPLAEPIEGYCWTCDENYSLCECGKE